MEKGMNFLRSATDAVITAAALATVGATYGVEPAIKPSDKGASSMAGNCSASNATANEVSKCLAVRIQGLTEVELPDEWYFAKGATPTERFRATFNAMRPGPGKPGSVAELMARYENHGEPIVHTVWLNQPLQCPQCNNAGADGFYTLVSIRNNVTVTVTAGEMHQTLMHQGRFPDEKIALLNKLFAPAAERP
jgi:hypothetical protein